MKKEVVGEGTHFMIPWVQRPIIYDIRARQDRMANVLCKKRLIFYFSGPMRNLPGVWPP